MNYQRCFKKLTYADLLSMVENAVSAYVEDHALEVFEGDHADMLDLKRDEWCRGWLHRHTFNVRSK